MLSESARMSSAAEARFRVQAPNSMPRAIKVIALDAASGGRRESASAAGAPGDQATLPCATDGSRQRRHPRSLQ